MSSTDWLVISQLDLEGDKSTGGFIRAYCHLHGSDKQRSLAINAEKGFGCCHACGAQVLVRELNPEAVANIERSQGRISAGEIQVRDPKYIARAARQPAQRTIEKWQQEEITLLRSLYDSMTARLHDDRASAYIKGRGLKLETAAAAGLGYIPDVPLTGRYARIARWSDHIVIPVYSPSEGLQFAGRCLRHWQPGMDENAHKDLLKEKDIERWRKTYAGGWFNFQALEMATRITITEGAFDALSLIEAGLPHTIAIIGTALDVSWLPKRLGHITLAFDDDAMGIEKCENAHNALYERGYDATVCHAPADDMGKDWSERYRLHGAGGLTVLTQDDDLYCIVCSAGVEYYSPDGMPYCAAHYSAA